MRSAPLDEKALEAAFQAYLVASSSETQDELIRGWAVGAIGAAIRAYLAATAPALDEQIDYAMQYGGRCRDCADNFGVCPGSGLPCEPKDARRAIRHVLTAIAYGTKHGYLTAAPDTQAPAVKALEWVLMNDGATYNAASILGRWARWDGHYMPPDGRAGIPCDDPVAAAQADYESRIRSALIPVKWEKLK